MQYMFQDHITIAITSCGRYSLLEKTIRSMEQSIDLSMYKKIITEDSQDPRHIKKMQESHQNGFLQWYQIIYTGGSGQDDVLKRHYYALKTLYEHIDTKYIFHCEDDQVFYPVDYDFIELSYKILEWHKDIAIIILRDLYKDYGIKKEGIMRSRYYDILTDEEQDFYWQEYIYGNPNAICSLQPWLRITTVLKQAMFDNGDIINEAIMSQRLSQEGYRGIYAKKWIYYNPNWRWNSTRGISNLWFFKYIKIATKNAWVYRYWLIKKYLQFLFSYKQ